MYVKDNKNLKVGDRVVYDYKSWIIEEDCGDDTFHLVGEYWRADNVHRRELDKVNIDGEDE